LYAEHVTPVTDSVVFAAQHASIGVGAVKSDANTDGATPRETMPDTYQDGRKKLKGLRTAFPLLVVCALMLAPGVLSAQGKFDGKWLTTVTCPPKGNTDGYTLHLPSEINAGNFRGEHGTAGEPGYLLIEGKIGENGSAKLAASGIVSSRQYARGVFAHKGEEYGYDVKAQFKETEGTGTRDQGMGIVGRPCTFEFAKQ
jgi:hypothetical protein